MSVTVAIIGRPNVGKSTLFNRLIGARHAIVDDQPGVTRDRREGEARLAEMRFRLFDTAGLETAKSGTLEDRMRAQTQAAIDEADITFMVIDGRAGLLPDDSFFATLLRKSGVPTILLVNKCEGRAGDSTLAEAWSLGLGTPVPISAAHGDGLIDIHDAVQALSRDLGLEALLFAEADAEKAAAKAAAEAIEDDTDEEGAEDGDLELIDGDYEGFDESYIEEEPEDAGAMRIAIVGRPNMGKSTLINSLLGESRLLTGPEAGITRDSITVPFHFKGRDYELADTAGMRRSARISDKVERLMVHDAQRAIQFAKVCVLMLDARQPPHKQDMVIARHIADEGRALVIAANMWDDVEDKQASLRQISDRLQTSLAQLRGVPVVPISGLYKQGLDKLFRAVNQIEEIWRYRISTSQLNRWLEPMLEAHPPPLVQGRRLRIRYMTQIKSRPPTFALFASKPLDLPESYLRYLIGGLRQDFGLEGIPIRMVVRKGNNPYAK
ncbi:MAG: ribosome biogenesis GTPase Der [Candidatus Puniceispirillaceae bacterium]